MWLTEEVFTTSFQNSRDEVVSQSGLWLSIFNCIWLDFCSSQSLKLSRVSNVVLSAAASSVLSQGSRLEFVPTTEDDEVGPLRLVINTQMVYTGPHQIVLTGWLPLSLSLGHIVPFAIFTSNIALVCLWACGKPGQFLLGSKLGRMIGSSPYFLVCGCSDLYRFCIFYLSATGTLIGPVFRLRSVPITTWLMGLKLGGFALFVLACSLTSPLAREFTEKKIRTVKTSVRQKWRTRFVSEYCISP